MKAEKVVNIIGMGYSAEDSPFFQGERWGINCSYVYGKMDRCFWLHQPHLIAQSLRIGEDTKKITEVIEEFPDMIIYGLTDMNIELISEKDGPELSFNKDIDNPDGKIIKKIQAYPILKYHKLMKCTYATSSLMYIIGLAIIEKFDRIRMYGIELFSHLNDNEYEFERQGVEHILSMAKGMGIKTDTTFSSLITASNNTNNLYGYKV